MDREEFKIVDTEFGLCYYIKDWRGTINYIPINTSLQYECEERSSYVTIRKGKERYIVEVSFEKLQEMYKLHKTMTDIYQNEEL